MCGYVGAYDVVSGEMAWRFFIVPGNSTLGFESDAIKKAVDTWIGECWKLGCGITVWGSMAFEADLYLLCIIVGDDRTCVVANVVYSLVIKQQ